MVSVVTDMVEITDKAEGYRDQEDKVETELPSGVPLSEGDVKKN